MRRTLLCLVLFVSVFVFAPLSAFVVNPHGYWLHFGHSNSSGTDSVDRFFGRAHLFLVPWVSTDTVTGTAPIRIPMTGMIRSGSVYQSVVTPGGAAADQFTTVAYRRSNASNTLISDTTISSGTICQHATCNTTAIFPLEGLAIPVVAGELGKIKVTTPAWTDANPTGIYWAVDLWVATQ